jgi:uncharacterized protein YbjT (DUF2867 family)
VRVLLFGATGMVGAGVLLECLDDPRVTSVLTVGRAPTGRTHPKLREVIRTDFFRYDDLRADFSACDACFFCLGVTSAGRSEAEYTRLMYDLPLAAARALAAANPAMTFCLVTGAGTDSSERGRVMWARVKGRAENAILALPFRGAWMFRPGFIQPLRGVRSRTGWYQALYDVARPLVPLLRRAFPRTTTTTVAVGRAMINVAAKGYPRRILTTADINVAAEGAAPVAER